MAVANSFFSKKFIYYSVLSILLIGSIFVLIRLSPVLITPGNLASDDFVHYWASGKLILQGLNPFNSGYTEQIRSTLGSSVVWPETTSITLTPPWVLPIIMIAGSMSYPVSRVLWLLVSIIILFLSSQVFWSIYAGGRKLRFLGLLTVFIFSPTISLLEKGQITCVMVLGLAGFLYFVSIKHNDLTAGVGLALVTCKPQLVLLFWLLLLVWVIQKRRWKILLSVLATILCLTFIAWLFNPHILQQYVEMLHSYGLSEWANPTIGSYLRFFWVGTDQFWAQFLPTVCGAIWLFYYVQRLRKAWDWIKVLPVILFASVITSPYAWTYDQVILIPALIQAVVWVSMRLKDRISIVYLIAYLVLNLLSLILHMKLDDFWFIWFAPILLFWYLLIQHQYMSSQKSMKLSGHIIG